MKMVGSIVQLTEDKPDRIPRPRMSEPWAGDFCNLSAAIKSLARSVEELREEIRAMKGQL